mmetsp:Transcript_4850/g.14017  ORF Transcript_4850/g.14017 Transcript_4850/m.14017 type:complete len:277 (-) Transcript_4850:1722-2552(-)
MKITQGANRRASVNTALAFFSDSPSHLFSTDEASTLRKLAPPSVATALASIVFPVPGGPNSRTPFTASRAMPSLYKCGNFNGYVMLWRSNSFTSDRPPIMSYVTPMSCGDATCEIKARSCLSCARFAISSLVRCAAVAPDSVNPPDGDGLIWHFNVRADSRLDGCKYRNEIFLFSSRVFDFMNTDSTVRSELTTEPFSSKVNWLSETSTSKCMSFSCTVSGSSCFLRLLAASSSTAQRMTSPISDLKSRTLSIWRRAEPAPLVPVCCSSANVRRES